MIKVVIKRTNEQLAAFEVSGHANSGPYGYDLVCAGVSAVTFGAINALMELCDLELIIDQAAEGYLYVELPSKALREKEAQIILQAMVVSLQTIERDYTQFIQITNE
jgi:uncharacterized protein YsxB (DUF464 family)